MRFYELDEDVPVNIYNFFMNIWLPIGTVVLFFVTLAMPRRFNWYGIAFTLTSAALVVVNIFLWLGMRRWKPSVIPLMAAEVILYILSLFREIVSFMLLYPRQIIMVLVPGLIALTLYVIVFLYLYKRKRLLTGIPYKYILPIIPSPGRESSDIDKKPRQ